MSEELVNLNASKSVIFPMAGKTVTAKITKELDASGKLTEGMVPLALRQKAASKRDWTMGHDISFTKQN